MKVIISLICLAVCAQASYLPAALSTKVISTGTSTQSRSQDAAGNYAFAYNEQHATGGSSRKEMGDAWNNVQGSYTLNVGDGRQRVVKYVADAAGFRAAISTNEPGTAAQSPANVALATPYLPPAAPEPVAVAVAPALAYAAPAYAAHAYAEPAYAAHAYAEPAYVAPMAVKAEPIAYAPALSAYSTSINHAAPAYAAPVYAAAPLALGKSGWY